MRRRIAAGNWKMNKMYGDAMQLIESLSQVEQPQTTEVILGVPSIYLSEIAQKLSKSPIKIAAQNCHEKEGGAYTGEISAPMLKSINVDSVIIGHSERRAYCKESDALLAEKANAALAQGLEVIFCCGEPLDVREAGTHVAYVKSQLVNGLFHLKGEELENVIIAYEPIWAIGTGVTASPQQAQEMHKSIRTMIAEQYGNEASEKMHILYGGSVKPTNAAEIFSQEDVDGGLVGGASLKAEDFAAIIKA